MHKCNFCGTEYISMRVVICKRVSICRECVNEAERIFDERDEENENVQREEMK